MVPFDHWIHVESILSTFRDLFEPSCAPLLSPYAIETYLVPTPLRRLEEFYLATADVLA